MRRHILGLLDRNGDLPALPDIIINLQTMLRDPHTNARAIARTIETDPVLAGKILRLSNSVFYSRSASPIKTLPVAITKIGLNALIKLVYSLELTSLFSAKGGLDYTSFWRHVLATAILTQSFSKRLNLDREMQDITYLAGLMHDIGILVFSYLIPDEYSKFIESAVEKNATLLMQERETFGIDHAEIGALFIRKWWRMDDQIVSAVLYHHEPDADDNDQFQCALTISLANSICNGREATNGIDVLHEPTPVLTGSLFNKPDMNFEGLMEEADEACEQAKELLITG